MHLRLTDFGILTIVIIILTFWFAIVRSNLPNESNWPLTFWGCLIAYAHYSGDLVHPYIIYAGAFLALMIRFEFLTQSVIRFIYALEWFFFVYIIIRGLNYVLV